MFTIIFSTNLEELAEVLFLVLVHYSEDAGNALANKAAVNLNI